MAKVTFGNGVSNIAGSIGGNTYSRNRFGAYIRIKRIPVNPRTSKQTIARGQFGAASSAWRALPLSSRLTWTNAAVNISVINPGGYPTGITGSNLFTSYSATAALTGVTVPADAPAADAAGVITEATMITDASENVVEVDASSFTGAATALVLIYATRPLSAGITFIKPSDYRFMAATTVTTMASGIALSASYIAQFGNITGLTGKQIAFKYVVLSLNGYRGVPFEQTVKIVA